MLHIILASIYYIFAFLFIIPFYPLIYFQIRKVTNILNGFTDSTESYKGKLDGNDPEISVLIIGDGNVAGYGIRTPEDKLPIKITEGLRIYSKRKIIWSAISHKYVSSDSISQLIQSTTIQDKFDLIIFIWGMNDILRFTSYRKYHKNISHLIGTLLKQNCPIVFTGILPVERIPAIYFPLSLAGGLYSHGLDQILQKVIKKEQNVTFCKTPAPKSRHFTVNGIIPDRLGNTLWGEYLGRQMTIRFKLRKQ